MEMQDPQITRDVIQAQYNKKQRKWKIQAQIDQKKGKGNGSCSIYIPSSTIAKIWVRHFQATGRNLRAKDGELQANQAKVAISIFHYFHGGFHEYLEHVYATKTIVFYQPHHLLDKFYINSYFGIVVKMIY